MEKGPSKIGGELSEGENEALIPLGKLKRLYQNNRRPGCLLLWGLVIAWITILPAPAKEPTEFAPEDTAFFARIGPLRELSAKAEEFLPQVEPELPPNLPETLLFGYLGVTSPALAQRVERNSPWGVVLPEKGQAPVVVVPTTDYEGFLRALRAGAGEAQAEGPYERAGPLYVKREGNYACVSTSKEMLDKILPAPGGRSLARELSRDSETFESFKSSDFAIYASAGAIDLERTAKLLAEKIIPKWRIKPADYDLMQNALIETLKGYLSQIRWVVFTVSIREAGGLTGTLFIKCRPEGKIGKALLAQKPVRPEWLGFAGGEPLFLLETDLNLEPFSEIYLDFCQPFEKPAQSRDEARAGKYLSLFTGRSLVVLFASAEGMIRAEEIHQVKETDAARSLFRDGAEKGYILFPFSPILAGKRKLLLKKDVKSYRNIPIDMLERRTSNSTAEKGKHSRTIERLSPIYAAFAGNKAFLATLDVRLLESLISRAEGTSSHLPKNAEVSKAMMHLPEKVNLIGFVSIKRLAGLKRNPRSAGEKDAADPDYSSFSMRAGKDCLRIDFDFPLEEITAFRGTSSGEGPPYISHSGAIKLPSQ